jgi:cell division protein FtsB
MAAPVTASSARRPAKTRRVVPQLVAIGLVLGLVGAMAIQPTRQLLAQRDRIGQMSGDLNRLQRDNRRLQERVEQLNDPHYLEQEARRMGLTRPGETTYVVVPPSEQKTSEDGRPRRRPRPATAEDPGFLQSFLQFVGLR